MGYNDGDNDGEGRLTVPNNAIFRWEISKFFFTSLNSEASETLRRGMLTRKRGANSDLHETRQEPECMCSPVLVLPFLFLRVFGCLFKESWKCVHVCEISRYFNLATSKKLSCAVWIKHVWGPALAQRQPVCDSQFVIFGIEEKILPVNTDQMRKEERTQGAVTSLEMCQVLMCHTEMPV